MHTRNNVYAGSLLRLFNLVRWNSDEKKKKDDERKCVHVLQHSPESNCEL